MNDDGFGGELHAWIEPEIEVRLVALILGEASDFEAEELERMMKERPELRIFKRRLEVVHSLMGEAVKPGDDARWRLAPERRAVVMEALGIAAPEEPAVVSLDEGRERRVRRAGLRVAMMAAACLVISVLLAPFLLLGTQSGIGSASYSMPTDGRQMEKESVAHWKRASRSGDDGRMVGRPMSGRGEDRAARSVGEKLAALKENLGTELTLADEAAPADVVVNGALFGRSDANVRELQESKPSSSMARGTRVRSVPAPTARPTPVPVPDVEVPEPSADFGSGDDFGAGWGAGGGGDAFGNGRSSGRAGEVAENAKVESSMGELAARIPPAAPAAPVTGPAAPAEPAPSGQPEAESLALVKPKAESATESFAVLDGKAGEPPVTAGYRGHAAKEDPGVPPVEDLPMMGRLFRQTANSDQSGEAGSVDPFVAEAEHFYDDGTAAPAKEVRLKTKSVEVKQANNEEMDFKWIEDQDGDAGGKPSGGPANRSQGMAADASAQESKNEWFLGGGSVGGRAGADRNAADFVSPVAGATIPGIPAGADQNGDGVVTGGLRSGDAAVSRNSIDAILNNPTRSADEPVPPGVMAITGLASDAQLRQVQRDVAKAEQKGSEGREFDTRAAGVMLESGVVSDGAPDEAKKRAIVSSGARIEVDAESAGKQAEGPARGAEPGALADTRAGVERFETAEEFSVGGELQKLRMRPLSAQVVDEVADGLERDEEGAVAEDVRKEAASLAWVGQTKGLNAENTHAKEAKTAMDDPVRTSPAMDPGSTQDIDKVRRELYTGEGLYNLGKFEEATKQFQEALRTDPHNQAARRWMERIAAAKSDYYRAAYDETRAGLLAEVDKAWEEAVPPEPGEGKDGGVQSGNAAGGAASMTNKLDAIVIPKLDLEGATVEEALDLLRQRTRELDNNEIDPEMKGVNLVLRKARIEGALAVDAELDAEAGLGTDPGSAVIDDLQLENVTLRQALEEIGDKAGMRVKADEYAVTLLPAGAAEGEDKLTRRWSVPSSFVRDLQRLESADGEEADPFADDGGSTGSALKARKPLAEMLREHGVELPPGASASFLPDSNTLVVKSAPGDLEVVDSLVQTIGEGSPPVDYMGLYEPPAPVEEEAAEQAEDLAVADKLRTTIIPMVDFDGTTVEEAVEFLRQRSVELDVANQGVNFSIQQPRFGFGAGGTDAEAGLVASDPGQARIKALKLRNVPLAGVLEYVADQAGLRYQVKDGKVNLVPLGGAEGEDLRTRRWKLHPDVLKELQDKMMAHAADQDDPFAAGEPRVRDSLAQMTVNQKDLIDILKDCGISFPEGTTVMYLPDHQSLVVRNTPSNLELVDALMAQTAEELARERQSVKTNEKSAAQEAFSTFSLHVSDVSFKLAQAALAKGEWPDPERIRVEEFVNAFDYGDPAPSQDEKVACALEQAAHPFMQQRNLLRISMRTAAVGRAAGTPLRLTVLLDNSGSMERADRVESVKRAFELLAAQMHPEDEVTLISFARQPRLLRDSVPGNKAGELVDIIRDTPSEGGTNLEEALRLGLEKAQEDFLAGAQNRIIMLTDGAANLGSADPELLAQLVERMRQKGIAFDACGVGADGLNDDVLEALTRKGDGRYYLLDRPEDADAGFATQIAGALRPAAKNVKVQVEFNPKRVGRYRLYGFEKHELKKEDFRNDSVDAAEMAAEEAGVAIYQVETLPDGEGDVGSVSVRFQDMASGEMIEKRWTIPYEASPAVLEDAVPSMRLAASAAFLGEKLKGSPVGELVELGELSGVSRSLQAVYPSNERVAQLIEMIEKVREATR